MSQPAALQHGAPPALDPATIFANADFLEGMPASQLAALAREATSLHLSRGAILIRQGETADALYIVLSGRFSVWLAGKEDAVGEIGAGQPIGEIGFFARLPRTATVTAARDSHVLRLDRFAFERIAESIPKVYESILNVLARRLARTTARLPARARQTRPRTVVVAPAGDLNWPAAFLERLARALAAIQKGVMVTGESVRRRFAARDLDGGEVRLWLNRLESEQELILLVADPEDEPWTRLAMAHADELLLVATGAARPVSALESRAFALHPPRRRRLARLHERRSGWVEGTSQWLDGRSIFLHHHLALEDDADFQALIRFLTGKANGFVAAGGGAFGSAHVGLFKAFGERGVAFDMFGGASVGAAMLAGFAMLFAAEDLDDGTHDIFVRSRGFKRPTWPRYALLDHTTFDAALKRQYRGVNIEDMWKPYFALATDLSANAPAVLREGPVWQAVRASSAIPGVLPPMYPGDGRMLVDGGVTDNIPLDAMQGLKEGPNLVVHFGLPRQERFDVDYARIPGRNALLNRMFNPFTRHKLPRAPGPVGVLQRALMAGQSLERMSFGPRDLVLRPVLPQSARFMGFDDHHAIFQATYRWGLETIDQLISEDHPAMAALLER